MGSLRGGVERLGAPSWQARQTAQNQLQTSDPNERERRILEQAGISLPRTMLERLAIVVTVLASTVVCGGVGAAAVWIASTFSK